MNKQSSAYTVIYIIVLVVVVGSALAVASLSLRGRQQENANADKMIQILNSVHISPDSLGMTPAEAFAKYIPEQFIVDEAGNCVEGNAFDVDMAKAINEPAASRELPVFKCVLDNGDVKYILPVYGAGLWGPIWGYLSFDSDGSTVYGAYFAHQGETPGLGAEIEKPFFCKEFENKHVFVNGVFHPIEVVKKGQKPENADADYVDGVTGGTITSKGVGAMIDNCLVPYQKFLGSLASDKQ